MSMPQLLRNAGYSKEAGIGVGLGSLLNVALDPLFMFVILPQGYENVANVFEAKCVFKPYYEGYQQDDIIEIPMTKDEFYQLNEKKQRKIFKRAERKHNHK